MLEAAGMNVLLENIESLPTPDKVDEEHREWRKLVMQAATAQELPFTHGVAAKLINVYLKAGFVCGGHHESQRVQSLHPPIDAVLLNELAELDVGGFRKDWKQAMKIRWSNFNSEQYEAVIQKLRVALDGEPLWMAEQYWQGYQ